MAGKKWLYLQGIYWTNKHEQKPIVKEHSKHRKQEPSTWNS